MYVPSPTDKHDQIAPEHGRGPTGEAVHVHRLLRGYIRDLTEAGSQKGIAAALAAFGAHFRMPHVEMAHSRGASPAPRKWIEVCRSTDVPQQVSSAFRNHPLRDWARHMGATVSLTELDAMLVMRGLERAPELRDMQALLVNVQAAPDHVVHCLFYGEYGADDGLARSMLHLATLLAHERVVEPVWPVAALEPPATLTPREWEVVDLAMEGASDAEIAGTLGVAKRTIRFHLTNAMHRTGVPTRAELIARAAQHHKRRRL